MAIKWMWGFEIGADRTFYSGSGWDHQLISFVPSGTFDQYNMESKFDDLVDYRFNFPHQPTSSVGGGYYSLQVRPPVGIVIQDSETNNVKSLEPFGVMTPPLGSASLPALSFSLYNDLDQTQLPLGDGTEIPVGSGWFLQRFLALYPTQTTLISLTGAYSAEPFMSGAANNYMPDLPPQLSLYLYRTASAGVVEDKILAFCQPGPVPQGQSNVDYFNSLGAVLPALNNLVPAGGTAGITYLFTSSAGTYISGNAWTEVSLNYTPHDTNGTLQVFLNGDLVIDQVGVLTGYTSSYDSMTVDHDPLNNNLGWGRILFTASPYFMEPCPQIISPTSTIDLATFTYDHVCMFEDVTAEVLMTVTSSIFIQGLKPTSDSGIGTFVGDDLGTSNLYNYINDPNDAIETSYIQAAGTTSASFELQDIDSIEEGAKIFDASAVDAYIGVGIIDAYENVGASNITVNSLMHNSAEALGADFVVSASAKQMSLFVSGGDPAGGAWSETDINNLKGGIKIL